MATNLFTKAKEKAPKTPKKNEKLTVDVKGTEFDQNLSEMIRLNNLIDQLTAERDVKAGIIKEQALTTFNEVYVKNGGYPGSFILSSESNSTVMFVPSDRYIKCDEDRSNELKELYCDELVTEKTEFSLKSSLVDKYGEVLSELIQNSPDINDEDKYELIQAKVTYSVSKGAIEKAFTWGKGKVEDFIRDIQPIFSLKAAK